MTPARIREARRRLGLTQRELAALAGVSDRTIRHLERGTTSPRPYTLECVRLAFEAARGRGRRG